MSETNETVTETAAPTQAEVLALREKELRKDYRNIQMGSIQKEEGGTHAGKLTVEIECSGRGCKHTRRVATSDLFQVRFCTECTVKKRAERRKAARKGKDGVVKVKATRKPRTPKAKPELELVGAEA